MWREEFGFDGGDLARLLETRPTVGQGGLTYKNGDSLAVFARGTYTAPMPWSTFFPECHSDSRCTELSDILLRPY
jgi:hypothetical protein